MSIVEKSGIIKSIAAFAVKDTFVGYAVVDMELMTDSGIVPARYIPDFGFRMAYDVWERLFYYTPLHGRDILQFDPEAMRDQGGLLLESHRVHRLDVCFNPSVGDYVRVGWDYQCFQGEILALAADRMPVTKRFEVRAKRTAAYDDIRASLYINGVKS